MYFMHIFHYVSRTFINIFFFAFSWRPRNYWNTFHFTDSERRKKTNLTTSIDIFLYYLLTIFASLNSLQKYNEIYEWISILCFLLPRKAIVSLTWTLFFFVKLNELLSPGRKLIFKALKTLSCPYPSSLSNALYLLKLIIASFWSTETKDNW